MRQGRRTALHTGWGLWLSVSLAASAQNAPTVEPTAVPGDPQPEAFESSSVESATQGSTPPRIETPGTIEQERPSVEALPRPWVRGRESRVGMPAASVDLDPAVIGPTPGAPVPKLYREGDFVVDRLGRLRALPTGATAFVFVDEPEDVASSNGEPDVLLNATAIDGPDARAMVLQPCQRLETMLSAAEQETDREALFRLTGQVHVYRGVNYLMPTELTGYRAEAPEAPAEPVESPEQAPADLPDAEADLDAAEPVTVGSSDPVDPDNPDAMLDAMAAQLDALTEDEPSRGGNYGGISAPLDPSRVRTARTIQPGGSVSGTGASPPSDGKLLREGEFVLQRAGRVVRSSDRREVLFTFEADGPELAEAPMGILPCRLRMWMEDAVARRGDAAVFVVSGRVTQFRGANYLLPVSAKLRVEADALGG
ncbi:MAG: hypothetical protein AAGH92_04010 [Planctomycetota bacterium]